VLVASKRIVSDLRKRASPACSGTHAMVMPNSALVTDACAAALRASYSAAV